MQTWPIFSDSFHVVCYVSLQDAVDILDTLLDQRNDMSFQVSTQVYRYY